MKLKTSRLKIRTFWFLTSVILLLAIFFISYIKIFRSHHLEYLVSNSSDYMSKSEQHKSNLNQNYNCIIFGDSRSLNLGLKCNTTINLSIGGETLNTLRKRLRNLHFKDSIKIIINLGINDFLFNYDFEEMVSNYKLVIDEINSLTDFSSIYCCELIGINAEGFFFNKNVINKNVENFNSEIKNWPSSNNSLNMYFNLDMSLFNNNLDAYLSSDGVHLNKLGSQNLDSIYNKIF